MQNEYLESNCYLIINENLEVIIIDPAGEESLNYIQVNSLKPKYIILTHGHFDHIMYVNKIRDNYSLKVICSSETALEIIDSKKIYRIFIKIK